MQDVRPLPAQQPDELEQAGEVAQRINRSSHVRQGEEAHAGRFGCLAERTLAVSRHGDVEAADERGQERGDVRLGPADLGERDQEQQARTPWAGG